MTEAAADLEVEAEGAVGVMAYCWPLSVGAGAAGEVGLHVSSPVPQVHVEVARVGATRDVVWSGEVAAGDHLLPPEADLVGCDWPVAATIPVDPAWRSGFYDVVVQPVGVVGSPHNRAFFVVRPADDPATRAPILVALSTNTWNAYNDVGGGNTYTGNVTASFRRPLARGLLHKPGGAGRRVPVLDPPDVGMHTHVTYLLENALTQWAGSSGWPNYEAPFLAWAEEAGYDVDVCTNADLERPDALDGHRLLLSVGHDEYWSWPMRDTVEAFVEGGGNVAFLSGNTSWWQVRLEGEDGDTMAAYKQRFEEDPVLGTDREHLLTSIWPDTLIGRPENHMTGVSFARGGYHRIGRRSPMGAGAYTVVRPEHWLLAGTELEYGDLLGAAGTAVGYECDGCAMAIGPDGRPVPTGEDGTPADFEIVAVAPAAPFDRRTAVRPVPDDELSEAEFHAWRVLGSHDAATTERLAYGSAVLGTYTRGGTVVTVGCTEWAAALADGDPQVETVTRTILDRLG
ncbi:hypothetical protein HC251_07490 [Iamia sp. SCSIO 61187]|uniref:N,N-dimethylformamidase beta subunit family domain-containing protein n=1 Tax=Iamia sp. SCSIO 61187 TaxID=2722752 RepID=UPI001C624FF1|nr:N,N-dimethylformamidase beta subunit family domain-containing protein [Iamia sp. SCSIO 61187]QYG92299.1 hypothetical protein HC251_07490 [Iamia sp. SCSIO 61187]